MRGARAASAAAIAALVVTMFPSASAAQDRPRAKAPIVRVYSRTGSIATSYVTPGIEVSEDAYVFAVSMDLDGQIQILHPALSGISVRILRNRELRLPDFFAGFSQSGGAYGSSVHNVSQFDYDSERSTRGTIIALASRAPFVLERVESDGDWDMSAIRSLIEHRTPASAAHALAVYLGSKDEPIGTDYMRFISAHRDYASTTLYSCDSFNGYGPGFDFNHLAVVNRVEWLRQHGQIVSVLGYDFCGMPIVAFGPSHSNQTYRPRMASDSADPASGRNHIPLGRSNLPRGRSAQSWSSETGEAAIGTFPLTLRPETPQAGEVLVPARTPNRRDPHEIFNDPRNERLVRESAERGRAPVERNASPAETPVIGTFPPAREYPRPIIREAPVVGEAPVVREAPIVRDAPVVREAPVIREAPAAVYERPSSPPPIIREQPSSPPPPPPRVEPQSRPEAAPAPVPPPKH